MSLQDKFHKWLYENYRICNGHMLTGYEENPMYQIAFLRDMGLPEDTEITDEVTA